MIFDVRATFEVALRRTPTQYLSIWIRGASVTNDADAVITGWPQTSKVELENVRCTTGTPMDALMSSRLMPVLLPDLHLVAKASRPPWLGCSASNFVWRTRC